MDHFAADFETFWSKKLKYSVRGDVPRNYARSPLFDPYLIALADSSGEWCSPTRDFRDWDQFSGRLALAHNAAFESAVWKEAQARGLIPSTATPSQWMCTADLTSYLCNERSLAGAMLRLENVSLSKAVRSDSDGKRWPEGFTPEEQKAMIEYGAGDGRHCLGIWNKYADRWPEKERRLSVLTREQGYRGVRINVELLDRYISQTHEMVKATEKLIPWIRDADDETWDAVGVKRKPTSTKLIAEQCRRSKIPCPPVKAHEGEEAYEEWVAAYLPTNPWIAALTSWRSIQKVHKKFLKMKDRLFGDEMPFALKYWGAHTGRWSGDAGLNMQNLRKEPLLADENSLMVTNEKILLTAYAYHDETGKWPEWVKFVIDERALIIPREGRKMIICDLSQVEARITRWFAGDKAMLDMIRGGLSIYTAHAKAYLGWKGGNELKKTNKDLYALCKARELALGFGCGWEKFILMAQTLAGVDLTKEDPEWVERVNVLTGEITKVSGYGERSRREVDDYRAKNLGVVAFWNQLNNGLRGSIGDDMQLELPNGRCLNYYGVRNSTKIVKNKETGKPEQRREITAEVAGKRVHLYGGKLAENMVQATARDAFGEHLLALTDAGHHVLFTAHDEAVLEVDPGVDTKDIEAIMSVSPDWMSDCPLGAEASEAEHYKK